MQTYNGYANYETWLISVQIDNDQHSIEFFVDAAKHHYDISEDQKYFTKKEEAIISFAEYMKEWYEENINIGGLWRDMILAALGTVDWHELAGKYMEQALENVEV